MIRISNCSNAKIAVFGLGISGLSTIKAIQRSGGRALAWDDKETSIEKARLELAKDWESEIYNGQCEFISPHEYNWTEIKVLVISPGIPTTFPSPHWVVDLARQHGCPIKCDIELFLEAVHEMRNCSSLLEPIVIAVTGTNGKSTTTALTGSILHNLGIECGVGGNIGIPVLDLAPKKAYVLELSSFQIELLPSSVINSVIDSAILLNLTPDHIDRHGSFENYIMAKEKLLANAKELSVICVDTKETLQAYERLRQNLLNKKCTLKVMPVSTKPPIGVTASLIENKLTYKCTDDGSIFSRDLECTDFIINLDINSQNITSAFVVVASLIPKLFPRSDTFAKYDQILAAIKEFAGLPHRAEKVGTVDHIEFVNDSKSTNADSSEKTLLCFDKIFWILGGQNLKGGDINSLATTWRTSLCKIQKIFLIGDSTEEFAYCLKTNTEIEFVKCGNLDNAFRVSVQEAEKYNSENSTGKITILLSPACASFDQWKNFEERGDAFRKLALEYIEQKKRK